MAMSEQNAKEARLVAEYKTAAALRLAERRTKNGKSSMPSDEARGAIITIRFAQDAKPLSAFGGVTKVLGLSCIQIPEYKPRRS
jgi:hypothetical protein